MHLLSEGELLGLDPQAPLERDLDVVHCAWNEVQRLTTPSTQQQRAALITRVQHALTRWLTHDPRAEDAYRRLMRVHITMGNPAAALRIYAICRARLAEELGVKPSADAIALAQHWHAMCCFSQGEPTDSFLTCYGREGNASRVSNPTRGTANFFQPNREELSADP